ncbi:hypothetical protein CSKR_111004 [Clonorchis sinensis]|uniref:Uncharacterized protein n=1 Tax=Clonorchis sinensis TaxID=79923 RepID=A0A419PW47_CLOSI|nr:hypothetical protein CSKR_111004 [Clonorchis sinensis]
MSTLQTTRKLLCEIKSRSPNRSPEEGEVCGGGRLHTTDFHLPPSGRPQRLVYSASLRVHHALPKLNPIYSSQSPTALNSIDVPPAVPVVALVASARLSVPPRFRLDECNLFHFVLHILHWRIITLLLRLQCDQWRPGELPYKTRTLLHVQLASCPRQPQLYTKHRLHTVDELVRQQLLRRRFVQRLLQVGKEHRGVTSMSNPDRLGPPHSLLAVGWCVGLCCNSFLRGDPVHLPRLSSSCIQNSPRPASEHGLQCFQINPVAFQPIHPRKILEILQGGLHIPILKRLWPRDLRQNPEDDTK